MTQLPNWALNWKTAEMSAAEYAVDDAAAQAETAMAEADRALAEAEQNEKPPSEEEIEQIRQYANDPKAPPEWRELADRVNRGEFSWADLLAGRKDRDQGVVAAMDASMRRAEDNDDEQQDPPAPTFGARSAKPRRRPARADDFDGDFSERTYLKWD